MRVGGEQAEGFSAFRHASPMLSLDNAYGEQERLISEGADTTEVQARILEKIGNSRSGNDTSQNKTFAGEIRRWNPGKQSRKEYRPRREGRQRPGKGLLVVGGVHDPVGLGEHPLEAGRMESQPSRQVEPVPVVEESLGVDSGAGERQAVVDPRVVRGTVLEAAELGHAVPVPRQRVHQR